MYIYIYIYIYTYVYIYISELIMLPVVTTGITSETAEQTQNCFHTSAPL